MEITSEIAKAEARLRVAGVSVRQFCKRANVHPATWHRWKNGSNQPHTSTWERVTEALAAVAGEP